MLRILIIDDNPKVIRDILHAYGYETEVATDGYSGLQTLFNRTNYFDLIILDVQMPKMDGWSVLRTIREGNECPNIPIVMLTGVDNEESVVSGLRRGADEYLIKPITPPKLLAHIEALARRIRRAQPPQDNANLEMSGIDLLTKRETEILRYVVQGLSNQDIGEKLTITETTIKNHLVNIYKKLNVANRTQAALTAQKFKLI